ncbi:MAG: hypothetical protein F9K44_16885 [Hyphomicrobiaceae bacterium]|nr:MAG: hypothetical protein F9K44_16885 [Hyphomicrobiaceae bacterium]MBZ0117977.1 hypothetical protein [Sandaracinaceae bacterium]
MKKSSLLPLAAVACLAVPATAGYKISPSAPSVAVNPSGRTASGSIGSAHNSSNSYESIYCSISGYETWTAVSCAAVNANNVFVACNITNPPQHMLNALAAMGPDSSISFSWSSTYKCTNISVWTGSGSYAKVPPATVSTGVIGGML